MGSLQGVRDLEARQRGRWARENVNARLCPSLISHDFESFWSPPKGLSVKLRGVFHGNSSGSLRVGLEGCEESWSPRRRLLGDKT